MGLESGCVGVGVEGKDGTVWGYGFEKVWRGGGGKSGGETRGGIVVRRETWGDC